MLTLETIIGGAVTLIIGAVGLWLGGKARGKDEAKAKAEITQANQAAEAEKKVADIRVESVKVANDIKDEVTRADDGAVRDKLRNDWTR